MSFGEPLEKNVNRVTATCAPCIPQGSTGSALPEAHVQESVRLIQDDHAQILEHGAQLLRVLKVVQQSSRRRDLHRRA